MTPGILTEAERIKLARQWRFRLWSSDWGLPREDARLDTLTQVCTLLYDGDAALGERLAREAIWS